VVEAEVVEAEVVEAEVVEAEVVEAESLASISPADSMDVQPLTAPVATPSLVVETNLLLPAGEKATIPVTVLASQESTQVRALNLPKGARLIHRGTKINTEAGGSNRTDRYALMWMPPSDRSVIHVVIVQLLADGRVITSRRVQLVTVL
nr:hypothetical protein [Gammaproteobacteria bacterium]